MNIVTTYDIITFILRKERNGFLTIGNFNTMLDKAQLEVFEDFFSLYAVSQKVHDALSVFKVKQAFSSTSGGVVTFQSDYMHMLPDVYTTTGGSINQVVFPNDDEFVGAINSQLRPATSTSPIAQEVGNTFVLYPTGMQSGFYSYLRRPLPPIYAYTEVGRVITYDAGNSQDLEWSDAYVNKVIAKSLSYFGINLNDNQIIQYSQLKDKETV